MPSRRGEGTRRAAFDSKLGQNDGHLGAGRRSRSDYRLERERSVHLSQASVGRRCWLYGRDQASELSSLQTQVMLECLDAAKLPQGVCNVVKGRGNVVGAELVRNPDVAKISFTGSVADGQSIMCDGAATMKRVTLELGGKSLTVLLDDAALEQAIPSALVLAFMNSGQACAAGTRILVPKSRLDAVKRAIVDTMRSFPVGDPADPKTAVGPMVSQNQYERVQSYIRKGIEEGAEVLVGGEGHPAGFEAGYFVRPTVLVNVKNDMAIAQEEIFGSVLCVITYDSEDEAIRIANDSKYGLHAAVIGADLQPARRVASQIRTGRVAINGMTDDPQAPWGDLNTPASAVNTANTGSRRFSKPAPYLSLKEALS
jgi:aldehyde dehydrogenase (NAD+)